MSGQPPKTSGAQASVQPSAAVDISSFASAAPTRSLDEWQALWTADIAFPIESHRPVIGPVLAWLRRLARPFVRLPQNDLWERQRIFNLIVIEKLRTLETLQSLQAQLGALEQRLGALEAADNVRADDMMHYNDALYSRVDAKLDSYTELARQQVRALDDLSRVEKSSSIDPQQAALRALDDAAYLAFENRERGSREAVLGRIERYWDDLKEAGPVLDLGCGRGEVIEFLEGRGVAASGIDGNSAMVKHCQGLDLDVVEADLNEFLRSADEASLGAITCFHVIEHIGPEQLNGLLRNARRVLRPGGLLLLETPNPLSVVVGASAFWVDATHQKPIHPTALRSAMELVGFSNVEIRTAQPFPPEDRLPEIELSGNNTELDHVADGVNRLRDRLDGLLFGDRDFAALGRVPRE